MVLLGTEMETPVSSMAAGQWATLPPWFCGWDRFPRLAWQGLRGDVSSKMAVPAEFLPAALSNKETEVWPPLGFVPKDQKC